MLQQRSAFVLSHFFCFGFCFMQMEETYLLQLVTQPLRAPTVCGGRSCWSISPCHPTGSAIAAPLPGTKHHPSSLPVTCQFAGVLLGWHGSPFLRGERVSNSSRPHVPMGKLLKLGACALPC